MAEESRYHIVWQRLTQFQFQFFDVDLCFGSEIGAELGALSYRADTDHSLLYLMDFLHFPLNLSWLYSESPDFQLSVSPSKIFELAIHIPSCEVASVIDVQIQFLIECEEFLGEFWLVPIAFRHLWTGEAEFTYCPHR